MQNSVSGEINVLAGYFVLGLFCAIIFDVFKAIRFGKVVKMHQVIFQDVLYYLIISIVIFNFILKLNGAEIRIYMICSAIGAFLLYRFTISKYVVRIFIWMKKLGKYALKLALLPIITLLKLIFWPFLKIKQKLLAKKAKIALTFKQFCFKIKCNVGMVCKDNKLCKERKKCRIKQKPGKKV